MNPSDFPEEHYYHIVTESESGTRIDKIIADLEMIQSRSEAQRLMKNGFIRVNESCVSSSYKLRIHDKIQITLPPPELLEAEPEFGPLDILFEDENLIVINKAPGVVVHPAPGHSSGTLVNYLLYHCGDLSGIGGVLRPGIVHRIDKDTSGVLVVTKNDQAHQHLSAQFKKHSIHRKYLALVWGNPPHSKGTVDAPLGRHPHHRKKFAVVENGKHAVTHWRVVKRYQYLSLLACQLETGRTHQIRIHLSSIKHPLVGDSQYGSSPLHQLRSLPSELSKTIANFGRQALHAEELGFIHPVTQQYIDFSAPPPEDFNQLRQLLDETLGR